MVWQVVRLAAITIGVIIFVFIEILDWQGRFDIIEKRHPRAWSAINNRSVRLMLLCVAIAYLAKDFTDAIAVAPAPIVRIQAPATPAIGIIAAQSTKLDQWGLDRPRRATLLRLATAACAVQSLTEADSVRVVFNDRKDARAIAFADVLATLLREAGCKGPREPGTIDTYIDNSVGFLGIKLSQGYSEETQLLARSLRHAFMQVGIDAELFPEIPEPTNGHGIIVCVGAHP